MRTLLIGKKIPRYRESREFALKTKEFLGKAWNIKNFAGAIFSDGFGTKTISSASAWKFKEM